MQGILEHRSERFPDTRHNSEDIAGRACDAGAAGRSAVVIGAGHHQRGLAPTCVARLYRVRQRCGAGEFATESATEFSTITQALAQWSADKEGPGRPRAALIEICDSATYQEAPHIVMAADERLEIRATHGAQPVLRMCDYLSVGPEKLRISGAAASVLRIDGLVVAGGAIEIDEPSQGPAGRLRVTLRHCTLVPGWDAQLCSPAPWRGKASLVLRASDVEVRLESSISGPIRVARRGALLALQVNDSIIDAGHEAGLALADDAYGSAQARLGIARSTVIGVLQVEALSMAEDSVFLGPLVAVRRDAGRVVSCYLAPGSRTPPRLCCLPHTTLHWAGAGMGREGQRPRYVSLRYGAQGYCQLAPDVACAPVHPCHDDAQTMRLAPGDYVVGRDAPRLAGAPH